MNTLSPLQVLLATALDRVERQPPEMEAKIVSSE